MEGIRQLVGRNAPFPDDWVKKQNINCIQIYLAYVENEAREERIRPQSNKTFCFLTKEAADKLK